MEVILDDAREVGEPCGYPVRTSLRDKGNSKCKGHEVGLA